MVTRRFTPLMFALTACATTKPAEIHQMGREGDIPALIDAWKRADSDDIRIAVVEELALRARDDRGREVVLRQAAADNAGEALQIASVRALALFEGADALRILIARLGGPIPSVRSTAEEALGTRSSSIKPELMLEMASNASPLVRAACIRLVWAAAKREPQRDPAIDDAFIDRATHDDIARVREAAVVALGMLNVTKARAQLVELMRTDEDPSVRSSAERAIQKLGDAGMSSVIVAVLPLRNNTGLRDPEIERLGAQIAEYVAARLSQGKACQVVDREKVSQAIAELKKVGALLYDGDAPNVPAIGKFKIANQLVYGSLQKQGLVFTIVLDRMDISTNMHVPGAAVALRGFRADLDALKVKAADQLIAGFR